MNAIDAAKFLRELVRRNNYFQSWSVPILKCADALDEANELHLAAVNGQMQLQEELDAANAKIAEQQKVIDALDCSCEPYGLDDHETIGVLRHHLLVKTRQLAELQSDLKVAHGQYQGACDIIKDLDGKLEAARGEVRRLVEALKPFAALDQEHNARKSDEHSLIGINSAMITCGDVRLANALLTELGEG